MDRIGDRADDDKRDAGRSGDARDDVAFEIDGERAGFYPSPAFFVRAGDDRKAPSTGPSIAPIPAASAATRDRKASAACQRPASTTTSVEITTSPARNSGAKAPAMPKLTRQFACRAAFSTRAVVRSRSPAPTTVENPAARAILASAASPEVHSIAAGNVDMTTSSRMGRRGRMLFHEPCGYRTSGPLPCHAELLSVFGTAALRRQMSLFKGRTAHAASCRLSAGDSGRGPRAGNRRGSRGSAERTRAETRPR